MTYEQALEIAMEELYDAVEVLRRNNKGYPSRVDLECNRLLTARNVLCKALEDAETDRKREADLKMGAWLSAALEDPSTCQSMKDDINEWFECTHQEEIDRLREKKKQIYEDLKDLVDREWVGLTRDEFKLATGECLNEEDYWEAIESKLKEKNT